MAYFRLLLDENISPTIVPSLWSGGTDAVALRDRGMLQYPDADVWRYAAAEDRTIVTINGCDFRKMAERSEDHAGLVIIPSGGTRELQLKYINAAQEHATSKHIFAPSFRRAIAVVDRRLNVGWQDSLDIPNAFSAKKAALRH